MKKLLLTLLLAGASIISFAQSKGKISGSLFDEKKQALPFASVLLLKAQDSTLVKGGVSDIEGKFLFEQFVSGNEAQHQYIISVSMVGYKKYYSPKIIISNENPEVNLANIQLELDTKNLKEVTVTAKKPFVEQQADKMVVNVEGSIVANGNTALEVLQKSPGVTVDNNDNISVKGKQGVLILMDGKPTYMSQSDLANQLKNMNSDQIEKIEIISNPSSRYDAAGKAVINIVTKKNKNYGTNGSISVGGSASLPPYLKTGLNKDLTKVELLKPGIMPKFTTSLNLNNRQGKFNTFANLTFSDNQRFNNNAFEREIGGQTFEQYAYRYQSNQNFSYKLGTDYYATKKTTLGVLITGNVGAWESSNPNRNITYMKRVGAATPDSSLVTTSSNLRTWTNTTFNANLKHTFDSTGKEITADIDYSIYNNQGMERGMISRFYKYVDKVETEYGTPLNITSNTPNIYNIFAVKSDYVHPLAKAKAKLEFGVKSSWVKSDNDIRFYQNGQVDKGRTNHFIYTENINAAYANFSKELSKKFNLQAGLRMEHTHSEGKSVTLNESRKRDYVKLFPSVFLTQTINKDNQLTYSYSRRIDRPGYNSLNPFIYFLDPYTYQLGNEYLMPQYTNSFELTHSFKQAFVTSVGYSITNDYMAEVIKNAVNVPEVLEKLKKYNNIQGIDPEKITFATTENIARFENININFSVPIPVTKWWNSQNNISVYYNKFTGQVSDQNLNVGQWAYNFYTSQSIKLPKDLSAEISMWYNSPNVYGIMQGKAQYAVNAGLQKSLWNKKATLRLNINDIFLTSFWRGQTDFAGVKMLLNNRWDSRMVRLSFSYKFGNQNVKAARGRSTATESEQRRAGGN
ncbi:outer membrane beta-barrel protein [Emticicia sp. 17c]|uniref:outer membrane beta-barrel protein n=1 Tax=Emticicia sp. 17c TaxID=3127704 RepID=UPI00301DB8B9